jgi:hypothetical protein
MWMFVSISCGVPTDHDTFDLIQLLLREKFGHAERSPKLKDHVKYGLPKEYVFGKEKLFFSISGHTTICKYYLMCLLSCESLGEPVPHCASSQTYCNLLAALLGLPRKKIKLKLESTDGPTLKKQARRGNCKSKKGTKDKKGLVKPKPPTVDPEPPVKPTVSSSSNSSSDDDSSRSSSSSTSPSAVLFLHPSGSDADSPEEAPKSPKPPPEPVKFPKPHGAVELLHSPRQRFERGG